MLEDASCDDREVWLIVRLFLVLPVARRWATWCLCPISSQCVRSHGLSFLGIVLLLTCSFGFCVALGSDPVFRCPAHKRRAFVYHTIRINPFHRNATVHTTATNTPTPSPASSSPSPSLIHHRVSLTFVSQSFILSTVFFCGTCVTDQRPLFGKAKTTSVQIQSRDAPFSFATTRLCHEGAELNHALSLRLSRPMSSGHHISVEHRQWKKHQKLNSDTLAMKSM